MAEHVLSHLNKRKNTQNQTPGGKDKDSGSDVPYAAAASVASIASAIRPTYVHQRSARSIGAPNDEDRVPLLDPIDMPPGSTNYTARITTRIGYLTAAVIFILFLALGAYFSPLGSMLFLGAGSGGSGGGTGNGTVPGPPTCDVAGDCDTFVVNDLVVEGGITSGTGNASVPVDIRNEEVLIGENTTVIFAAGSAVQCPAPGFLNDCVNEVGGGNFTYTPTCLDYTTCNDGDPFTVGTIDVENVNVGPGGTLVFDATSSVTCPSTDFLNDCVDEFYVPTCTEHATCTDFLVQGMDVNGGNLDLLSGAILTAAIGSRIDMGIGSQIRMELGSTLTFQAGSSVTCPTTDFLNDCVDEFYTPTCTEHAACTDLELIGANVDGGSIDLLSGASITTSAGSDFSVAAGASVTFVSGSSVSCPTPDFFNDCVDEFYTPTCTEHSACTDLLVEGIDVNGGSVDLLAGASVTTSTGSSINIASGASVEFDTGSAFVCPTPGFLNNCVDEAFTPTCATNYDQCDSGDPLVVGVLQATEGLEVVGGNITFGAGTQIDFSAGSSVTCPSPGFLNGCVDEPFTPTCATNYDQCGSGDPLVVGALEATEGISVNGGATLAFAAGSSVTCPTTGFLNGCVDEPFTPTCATNYDQCNSGDPLIVGAISLTEDLTVASGSSLTFELGSTVVCPDPGFLNDCVDESGINTPTCQSHATCTNFTVTGLDVDGGTLDLEAGADLTTTSGSSITVVSGASLNLNSGASVTCDDPGLLNDCVNEFYTPTCVEHTACTDFEVTGVNVQGGTVDLLSGADILGTSGTEIRLPNGASSVYEAGSLLQFDTGASVSCPTTGFLNDCVDEPFTPTCATNYDQCNSGDPLVVGAISLTEDLTVSTGSTLTFELGSSVTCPTTGFLNSCVDEFYTPTCDEHAACANLETLGATVTGGNLDLAAGATLSTSEGSTITMANNTIQFFNDGSTLTFNAGSSVTCPTPGFLNDCVDEAGGGGSFTPTCTVDYASCTDFAVQGIDVSGGTVDLTGGADMTMGAGSTIEMASTSAINMASGSDINVDSGADINVLSGGDIIIQSSADISVLGGGAINYQSGSTERHFGGSNAIYDFTSSIDFLMGNGQITCSNPVFDPSSGCTSGTFTPQCTTDYALCGEGVGDQFTVSGAEINTFLFMSNGAIVDMPNVDMFMYNNANLNLNNGGSINVNSASDINLNSGSNLDVNNLATQTFASGSTLVFEAGASVTCPSSGFLNDCVDETGGIGTFIPSCSTNYDQCNALDPFIVHTMEPSAAINMATGTAFTMESGSTLNFNAGSTVTCPTSGFLNACVDEAAVGFTPTCSADYAGCTLGDPFVVNTIDLTNDLLVDGAGATVVIESSGELQINSAGQANVNSGGVMNVNSGGDLDVESGGSLNLNSGAVQQVNNLATVNINSGGNLDVETGGNINVRDGGDIVMDNGGSQIFTSGSVLQFNTGSVVTCPSPGFLNDCVDESGGGGSFTPTCSTDYDQCNALDPFIVHTVEPSSAINMATGTNIVLESGSDIEVNSGADVNVNNGGEIYMASGGLMTMASGSDLRMFSGAEQSINSGAITYVNGGLLEARNNGVVNIGRPDALSPATMNVNQNSVLNVESAGSIEVNDGGEFNMNSGSFGTIGDLAILEVATGGILRVADDAGGTNPGGIDVNFGGNVDVNSAGAIDINNGGSLDINSGGQGTVQSGGTIDVLSGGTIDVFGGGDVNLNSAANLNALSGSAVVIDNGAVLDIENGGIERVRSGGELRAESGSQVNLQAGSLTTAQSGSQTTFNAGANIDFLGAAGSVTCTDPIFDSASGCTSEPVAPWFTTRILPTTVFLDIAAAEEQFPFEWSGGCVTGNTLPCPTSGSSFWTVPEDGVYSFNLIWFTNRKGRGAYRYAIFRYQVYDALNGLSQVLLAENVACSHSTLGLTLQIEERIDFQCTATARLLAGSVVFQPVGRLVQDPFEDINIGNLELRYNQLTVTKIA